MTRGTKNAHCATCAFIPYAGFSQIRSHIEDSSTMLPGDETQEYECRHENRGTDQVWHFNDDVCGFETQIATESVHNTITCEKHTLTHTEDFNYVAR